MSLLPTDTTQSRSLGWWGTSIWDCRVEEEDVAMAGVVVEVVVVVVLVPVEAVVEAGGRGRSC